MTFCVENVDNLCKKQKLCDSQYGIKSLIKLMLLQDEYDVVMHCNKIMLKKQPEIFVKHRRYVIANMG